MDMNESCDILCPSLNLRSHSCIGSLQSTWGMNKITAHRPVFSQPECQTGYPERVSNVVWVVPSHYLSFISHPLLALVTMAARSWIQTMPLRVEAVDERRELTISVSGLDKVWTGTVWRVRCCTALSSCCHTCIITYITRVQSIFVRWIWIHKELFFSGCVVQMHIGTEILFFVSVNMWNELNLKYYLNTNRPFLLFVLQHIVALKVRTATLSTY